MTGLKSALRFSAIGLYSRTNHRSHELLKPLLVHSVPHGGQQSLAGFQDFLILEMPRKETFSGGVSLNLAATNPASPGQDGFLRSSA